MHVTLLAFATASDQLGRAPRRYVLGESGVGEGESATLGELERALLAEFPGLAPLWPRLAIAVDGKLVPVAERASYALREGAEVALLPPVSGGAPAHAELVDGPIDVAALQARVEAPDCGAVLLFLGNVRNHHAGRPVERLTYSAYRPMALERLQAIAEELEVAGVRAGIVHRLGEVPVGEASVAIAIAAAHRQAAYEASRIALERLKKEVPIWKEEHYQGGESRWREEEPLVADVG